MTRPSVTTLITRITRRYETSRKEVCDTAGWAALIAGVWILTSAGYGLLALGVGLLVTAAKD